MSAIKTHDHWEVVQGGEIKLEAVESEQNAPIRVRAVRISRTNPSLCELMTERTYTGGSISRTEHFIQHGHIQSTEPSSSTTKFNVSTRLNGEKLELNLTSVKSNKQSCLVM
tara:strand:- start:39 stop:374 length:336 start_codon:yes stop_codon:yes gene_type:complete